MKKLWILIQHDVYSFSYIRTSDQLKCRNKTFYSILNSEQINTNDMIFL